VNIEILNMGRYESDKQAIDVALPVLAIECEATPPLENFLDPYEETVLKFISLGLSAHSISKTLNATESLIDDILARLELKEYVTREIGKLWKLTEAGEDYLNGKIRERASSESQYGYMFVNVIKKEVLPYFYLGDVGQISLFRPREGEMPLRLTVDGDEIKTFSQFDIKQAKLKKAFKAYFRIKDISKDFEEGEITREEAQVDIFAHLDSLDEEIEDDTELEETVSHPNGELKRNMFVRKLNKRPVKVYLRMRIIIDPAYPGGYKAESPFDFGGIDNDYFLRQIQWLEQSENTYIDEEHFKDFLHREICKISPSYSNSVKDYQVFVLERLPLLNMYRTRFPYVYEDMQRIYSLMQRESSLLERENIVNNLARSVVEGLFNTYFRSLDADKLEKIQKRAFDEVNSNGDYYYKRRVCRNTCLDEDKLKWVKPGYLKRIIGRLTKTYGNSIMEKFINMMIVDYHLSNEQMHRFLSQPNIAQKYELIDKLNRIRRKVSHDTVDRFTNEDYKEYMANVFGLINSLLEAFWEDY
jgi:hypothetical protein